MREHVAQKNAARYLGGTPDPDAVMAAGRQAVALDPRVKESAQATRLQMTARNLEGFARAVARAGERVVATLESARSPAAIALRAQLVDPARLAQTYPGIAAMQRRGTPARQQRGGGAPVGQEALLAIAASARRRVMLEASRAPGEALQGQAAAALRTIDNSLGQAILAAGAARANPSVAALQRRVVARLAQQTDYAAAQVREDVVAKERALQRPH